MTTIYLFTLPTFGPFTRIDTLWKGSARADEVKCLKQRLNIAELMF